MCQPDDLKTEEKLSLESNKSKKSSGNGILYGSLAVFISLLGAAITFPFLQSKRDELGCDALCYGSMQSVRSCLSLIGSFLVCRLSDRFGRSTMLWIWTFSSLLSYFINLRGTLMFEIWLSMIPSSLLNQNFSVSKALFADYNEENNGSESDRASAMGRLGMAVGVAFTVGPVLGTTILKKYSQALIVAITMTLISNIFIFLYYIIF